MTTKFLGVLAAVPMLAFASLASADEAKPVALDAQALDGVTASGSAFAVSLADAIGEVVATQTATIAMVEVLDVYEAPEAGQLSLIGSLAGAESISVSE